jgi:hypothetical protein
VASNLVVHGPHGVQGAANGRLSKNKKSIEANCTNMLFLYMQRTLTAKVPFCASAMVPDASSSSPEVEERQTVGTCWAELKNRLNCHNTHTRFWWRRGGGTESVSHPPPRGHSEAKLRID